MSDMELGEVGKGKYRSRCVLLSLRHEDDKQNQQQPSPTALQTLNSHFFSSCLPFFLLFSVLTSVDESVKLCVKIIVVKVVISVLLIWSRISPKHVVTLDGELCGDQYETFFYKSKRLQYDQRMMKEPTRLPPSKVQL